MKIRKSALIDILVLKSDYYSNNRDKHHAKTCPTFLCWLSFTAKIKQRFGKSKRKRFFSSFFEKHGVSHDLEALCPHFMAFHKIRQQHPTEVLINIGCNKVDFVLGAAQF